MNSIEAKQISLVEYLQANRINPQRIDGDNYWYSSPLRQESKPSFKVNKRLNVWYDYGCGQGGNILDFVIKVNNCSVSDALKAIECQAPINHIGLYKATNEPITHSTINSITGIYNIRHIALIDYLAQRHISKETARKHCQEIHYKIKDKQYFAIGFLNDSGGYELRNKYAKMNLGGKDITSITSGYNTVSVFEGFFDYISFCQEENSQTDFVIMNSLALLNKTRGHLQKYDYVHLYLDNDDSGRKATQSFIQETNNCVDMSQKYKTYKDFNEMLVKREKG